ncbi:MAG: glycoside hydrolase family 3 C-terminal domain-containing protein [Anaerolineae bacterium]|nr:glycoside hydrolase family 3 C-terminal domain-containing protein [Anaerolineae bacterium]
MKILKSILIVLLSIIGLLAAIAVSILLKFKLSTRRNVSKLSGDAPLLEVDGMVFRDLNGNGRLDAYEDPRRPIELRVVDLMSQMTLEEKAGLMMQPMIDGKKNGDLHETPTFIQSAATSELVINRHINHFNIVQSVSAEALARWHNAIQKMAEGTRLGIPVTISTDPRHVAGYNPGAGIQTDDFSKWPTQLGLAATRDEALVEQFGDIARQEYLAVGIRTALHPMADLATEPRWARMGHTFGEDAELSKRLINAYVRGFQGAEFGTESVSCMVKHFPGGGPQADGWDAHFSYGRDQVYPGDNFDYHLIPFEGAFAANVTQVMPYYGIPVGQTSEDVAMGFNKEVITDLLRNKFGFDGVICTDWNIVEDIKMMGVGPSMKARAWGVDDLPVNERYQKVIEAGVDQFGGQLTPHHIVELVKAGAISEARLDESVARILRLKFQMGLFDNPYVDEATVLHKVGTPTFRQAGNEAMRKSVVLLKNDENVLPLTNRPKLYLENVAPEVAALYGDIVETPEEADFAILRLKTPYGPKQSKDFLERFFHQGDLDFKEPEKSRLLTIMRTVPTIVDIELERTAVIPEIAEASKGLFATFMVTDEVILDAIFGAYQPTGKLPVEMPSSMAAVRNQKEDLPCDSENPLFPFGFGLTY